MSGDERRPSGAPTVRRLAVFGTRLVYREVEVVERGRPTAGPVLAVSSHFGGVADAMLLLALSERVPRIVARDLIWKYPVARSIMRSIGAIPVRRRADSGGSVQRNEDMFTACYDALGDGDVVLIFPEGVTQEDPHLAPIRTGAARIALGARSAGVRGIQIEPVGIHYEDRAAFRSRVLVAFGEPIDLDAVLPDLLPGVDVDGEAVGADHSAAVRALTALIAERMGRVGPRYRDWDQARALHLAASVALREAGRVPDGGTTPADDGERDALPLALTERLAARLAARPAEALVPVEEAAASYARSLRDLDLEDADVAAPHARVTGRVVRDLVLAVVLLPYALIGALIGALPYLITQVPRLFRLSAPMLSTVVPMVALLAFLGQWTVLTVRAALTWSVTYGAVVGVLAPLFVAATVFVAERFALLGRGARRWWVSRRSAGPIARARHERADVLTAVVRALGEEAA